MDGSKVSENRVAQKLLRVVERAFRERDVRMSWLHLVGWHAIFDSAAPSRYDRLNCVRQATSNWTYKVS